MSSRNEVCLLTTCLSVHVYFCAHMLSTKSFKVIQSNCKNKTPEISL